MIFYILAYFIPGLISTLAFAKADAMSYEDPEDRNYKHVLICGLFWPLTWLTVLGIMIFSKADNE